MPPLSRSNLLRTIVACFVLDRFGTALFADVPANAKLAEASDRRRRLLESLVDPTLDLLPEYRGAKVYWLFHDNYLASKVLARSHPGVSTKIRRAIRSAGVRQSGKIEILFGEARRPLPFRRYRLEVVKEVGDKVL